MQKKYKELFSNSAMFAFSSLLSKAVLSAMLPVYTRYLTSSEYGSAEILTTVSELIIPICSLAIKDALFRFSLDTEKKKEDVLKNSMLILLMGSVLLLIVSFMIRFYKPIGKYWIAFGFISFLAMWRSALSLYAKAVDKAILFASDNILHNFVLGLANIVFLVGFHWKINGYFFAIELAYITSIIYLIVRGKYFKHIKYGKLDHGLRKEMLLYSSPLIINSISWGLTHAVDKVMLAGFSSTSATGIYSAASKVPSLLSLMTSLFTQAWSLSAIREYETGKDKKFYSNVFLMIHLGTMVSAFIILLMNNNLFSLILGEKFHESIKYVPVLLMGTVFLTYSNYYSPIYTAMKRSKQIMLSALGGAVINAILNALLIPKWGIMGASIATASSYIYIAGFRMINSRKYFKVDIHIKKWLLSVVTLTCYAIVVIADYHVVWTFLIAFSVFLWQYKKELNGFLKTVYSKFCK